MKRSLPVVLTLWACILATLILDVHAQSVKVKREAMSPGRRIGVAGPNYISTGLHVFAKGMKMYFSADTTGSGATVVTSFAWSLETKPAGSTATITGTKDSAWFIGDVTGQYIVKVDVNGGAKAGYDTVFASTYMGWPTSPIGCQTCHATNAADYAKTNHATMFYRGITGQLEIDTAGRGAYAKSCVRCHTTGWESVTDNGNFGYIANQTKWDSTWWKSLPYEAGDYWIPWKSMTLWNDIQTTYPTMAPVATIGCESCHGAGKDHNGDKTKIGVTFNAGICLQCHDAPNKHRIGSYWKASAHATMPLSGSRSTSVGCNPCHNGPALAAYAVNPKNPNYTKTPMQASISCQSCHDPHSNNNPKQLRIVTLDSLRAKIPVPQNIGGLGKLCMTCHQARTNTKSTVEAQARVFGDRFYSHYSPQTDMYFGLNGYEFGQNFSGLMTHEGVEDACVTCHMATRVNGSSVHSNHEMKMKDAAGKDIVTACKECHGELTEFDEIKAMVDYDNNGKIEGAMTEIHNLLEALKAKLPVNTAGDVPTMKVDSALVKNHPLYKLNNGLSLLGAMYNYYFIDHDWSKGAHNTKYTIALLKASFAALAGPTEIAPLNQEIPKSFALGQNYPNPFNPTTTVQFSLPRTGQVTLHIFNAAGQLVNTLVNGEMIAGNYTTTWNSLDAKGQPVGSGVFFYRINVTSKGEQLFTTTKKMVLMK